MNKKIKLIVFTVLLLSMFTFTISEANKFNKTSFNNWTEYNIYSDSNELSTLATKLDKINLAYIIVEAFDLKMKGPEVHIVDIDKNDWFNKYAQIAISNEIIKLDENNRFFPNEFILREELPKYLNYYKLNSNKNINKIYLDIDDASPSNRNLLKEFVKKGFIESNSEYIYPKRISTISDAILILDNMFPNVSTGISKGLEYNGNFILKEKMTYLENIKINGDLIITQGAIESQFINDNFKITLNNVTVDGNIYIYGGSHYGSYNVKNSKLENIYIKTKNPVIFRIEDSIIGKVYNNSNIGNFYTNINLEIVNLETINY